MTRKPPLDLHDWSVWRIELNEQLATILTERRSDLRILRRFLQSSSFYQKENHEENNGRLLFSIPRAIFRAEDVENLPADPPEIVVQPKLDENANDAVKSSISARSIFVLRFSSFAASDRIHATLQKAVKDGNVLEKIKAFEMQAAAAASSRMQSVTSSIQSAAHRTFVPAVKKVPSLIEGEDFSITAISSMPLQRTRQRRTTTPRRRWLKSGEKQEILIVKKKKKNNRRVVDENLQSDDEDERRSAGTHRQKLSSTDADDR